MSRDCGELLASTRQIAGANAIPEKAIVANADQTIRQDVEHEPAKELAGIELEGLLTAVITVVLVGKANRFPIEGKQSGFGDGDAVGVSGQISQDLGRAAEGSFGEYNPLGGACLHEERGTIELGGTLAKGRAFAESLT